MTSQIFTYQRMATIGRYALWGVLFGLLFPLAATLVDITIQELPVGIESALNVQRTNPLLWIVDSAPVILGLFAALVGSRQDALLQLNAKLTAQETEMKHAQEIIEQRVNERTVELVMWSCVEFC